MDNGFLTNELIEIEPPGNISLSSKENLVIIISTLQLTSLLYSPVKDKNSKLATSTKEQLEVWHNHYKCYTYLGIPFDKSLSLNPIIKLLNSKVTKALFFFI